MRHWIIFLFIHLVIPIVGIAVYILLVKRMKKEKIPEAPIIELFWLFGTYGVVLILILTSLIWKWSGMASFGGIATITIGPIITAFSAFSLYKKRRLTTYHKWTYLLSVGYIGLILLAICASLIYNVIN